ncbi:MAG: type II toxin-antitoxin system RelE/ParE family toxin [Candidatus Omnitrophota bacterium]
MTEYKIEFRPIARHNLRSLPKTIQKRIDILLLSLTENPRPRGVKKLKGIEYRWSLRSGDYRIVYEIHDDRLIVLVIDIDHRRQVYR